MKSHRLFIAIATISLAACATSESPESSTASMGKRPAGQENTPLLAWRAFGTEPFWNVNVDGDTLTFTTPDDQAGIAMQGTRRTRGDTLELSGTHGGKPFVLEVSPGECSDGMSDNDFDHTAEFRIGDTTYTGCAEAAK